MAVPGSAKMMVGIEVHVQLSCASKLFCGCPVAAKGAEPNSATCPTCLGMPGAKPVLNRAAVEHAILVSLALNCRLNRTFMFSRKTYFYPDLAKNYQITQYEVPVGEAGFLEVDGRKIRVRRVHLEEDPAALVHESGASSSAYSLVDYNRSGIPLVEIVTEPDMGSPAEARRFLDSLLTMLNYLGVYRHGESVLKADCNISVEGGERVEVKNVTGFRAVEDALASEFARQHAMVEAGAKVVRETRGFDAETSSTYSMRTKETEDDYGYIADSDLVPTEVDDAWLASIRSRLPELAQEKASRFMAQYGLKEYDAKVLASDKGLAAIFEECASIDIAIASRIVSRELMGILNYNRLSLAGTGIKAAGIAGLVSLIKAGKVSERNAKESLIKYAIEGVEPAGFLSGSGMLIDSGESDIEAAVREAVAENRQAFEDFRGGNSRSMNFIIGMVMRKLKGKADARRVQKVLEGLK
ncbi:MAG: Asp-tRNA(Asn)/Glu-tRNA(Gln) amidotransferase subunit GatB [Candidatus Diapherotrites archaeon]|uniref:Aspartyl/glutamyl-tRNA(Asn/Gln) amidotransferase subunit B n=1 Tax=Candidatus Iainarchaeum sp. TaxID=3101447 RepID=A0A8T3YLW4_9ARCH|nr:Asp-tRNA(Asn)/Glu-tRNA(Gln) amidotransferase subunit GatB [Candidatus Diapherotrites archaeon]